MPLCAPCPAARRQPAGRYRALGGLATHTDRLPRLRADGVAEHELARLHSPIGLDLGGKAPIEVAVAVLAEMVTARHDRTPPAAGSYGA